MARFVSGARVGEAHGGEDNALLIVRTATWPGGVFERFTARGRRVMVLAQEEAALLNHNFIGTEHLLLGLIHEGDGVAAKAPEQLGISLVAVRATVEETMGSPWTAASGSPPFTPRAKKVLELSLREALQLGNNYIGTEHILLGLGREGEGVAARVLVDLGADPSRVRQQVMQLLPGHQRAGGRCPGSAAPAGGDLLASRRSVRRAADCPDCRASQRSSARVHRLEFSNDGAEGPETFIVLYCDVCGHSLAFKPAD